MRQNNLSVHSENILPIIKKWLYSEKDIFIRELISNASDAILKARVLRDQGAFQEEDSAFKIFVHIDKKNRTLTIEDNGIGMSEEEVEKYIAQIAFSGAKEFAAKYSSETEKDPIIGHFGLGFYSAYMVASKVEIDTLSYASGAKPAFWSCDGSSSYTIGEGKVSSRGTKITLHLDDASQEYLEEAHLKELLVRYCSFMPYPIELNGKPIGNQEPLWNKSPGECTEKEYLDFYHRLSPLDPDPIFWIHLNVDYPFHLKGILYFPKIHRRFDANESTIQLFCNRVFVSESCKEILPDYLTALKGAIDSPDIPLNVSRSYLQVDKNVRQLSSHISKKVSDRLLSLYKTEKEKYLAAWSDVEMIVKLGVLQDEKFYERIKECLVWKNSEGNWTTVSESLEKAKDKTLFYSPQEASSVLSLYRKKGIEILIAPSPIDTAVIQFLENKLSISFRRIDGAIDEVLDASKEKTVLDADGKTEGTRIADLVRSHLSDVDVEAKSLSSDEVPALLLIDENQRRLRDYMALTQGKTAPFPVKKTLVVNTNSKLVQSLQKLQQKRPETAKEIVLGMYDLARLAQREMEPGDLEKTVSRQARIVEDLLSAL